MTTIVPPEIRKLLFRLGSVLFVGGIINCALFFLACQMLGGSAAYGKIEGGLYFLGDHGRFTQVSQAIYTYSYLHGSTYHLGCCLGMFGGIFMILSGRVRITGRNQPATDGDHGA